MSKDAYNVDTRFEQRNKENSDDEEVEPPAKCIRAERRECYQVKIRVVIEMRNVR